MVDFLVGVGVSNSVSKEWKQHAIRVKCYRPCSALDYQGALIFWVGGFVDLVGIALLAQFAEGQ